MRVFVVFSMVLLAAVAQQGSELASEDQEQERPRTFCGRNLARARMLYCLEDNDDEKRNSVAPLAGWSHPRWQSWWPALMPQQALALRGKRNPGLVDECCYKPCYISELLTYC